MEKVKQTNVGKMKVNEMKMAEPRAAQKYPEHVSFDDEDLPEIKGWQVGKPYKLTLEVKMTGLRIGNEMYDSPVSDSSKKDKQLRATFEIVKVKPE